MKQFSWWGRAIAENQTLGELRWVGACSFHFVSETQGR